MQQLFFREKSACDEDVAKINAEILLTGFGEDELILADDTLLNEVSREFMNGLARKGGRFAW